MQIKNTPDSYGVVTKGFHLVISLAFVIQYILLYWREYTSEANPLNLQLILLHKSIGFTLLIIGLGFIIWRFLNTKPLYPKTMAKWEILLATITRYALYFVILLMPLSGTLMSFMSGRGLKWFGLDLPNFFEINKSLAGNIYTSHVWMSFFIIALVILHVAGALKHHFIDKNNILVRMCKW